MTKKEDDLFLKSIRGAKPLKRSNKIGSSVPKEIKNQIYKKTKAPDKNIVSDFKNDEYIYAVKAKKSPNLKKTNLNKKLKKGKIPINKRIDLHGFSLIEAEKKFTDTVRNCYENNQRCILFITGKGINKNLKSEDLNKLYYGKIRRSFFSWW